MTPTDVSAIVDADDTPPSIDNPFTRVERTVTLLIVLAPIAAVVMAIVALWGRGIGIGDVVIGLVLYVVVGYGITIGYHRMLTHRSCKPIRPVKVLFAIAGSLAFEGGPISWVADHRRHHAFSDRAGDPHSPHRYGQSTRSRLRGLAHAHTGWLFNHTRTSSHRYAADLLADRDLVLIDRLFPLWCVISLAVPFGLGYAWGHTLPAALSALLWAGGVRIFLLHHVTWSVNSFCHTFGHSPFRTRDRSTNLSVLAIASLGESWHNGHHALPRSARHGLLRHQPDPSAALIGLLERLRAVTDVTWPSPNQIAAALVTTDPSR